MNKLTEDTKKAIHNSITGVWAEPLEEGAEPKHILDRIEEYVIGILELPEDVRKTFYKK